MNQNTHWAIGFIGLLLPAIIYSAEPARTGIVKGTVTIGGRPTADVVVSIEGLPLESIKAQTSDAKSKKALMDQRDMKFIPRVLAVLAGTSVDFPNNDKTFHNVFSASEAKKFDLGLYPPGKSRSGTFDKPGVIKILCNVHPSMEAYVVIKGHPFFAASDSRGNYQLNAVPLGKYRVEFWHPELGVKTVAVELVRDGEVLAIDMDLKNQN